MLKNRGISSAGRMIALVAISVLALMMSELPSRAAPASKASSGVLVKATSIDATDFSSVRRRRYPRRGNAAGLAFMRFAFGTIAGVIAAERRRDYYYDYGYYYGPRYYYPGPYYYRPRYYYYGY